MDDMLYYQECMWHRISSVFYSQIAESEKQYPVPGYSATQKDGWQVKDPSIQEANSHRTIYTIGFHIKMRIAECLYDRTRLKEIEKSDFAP
ncbi:hypothetical protein Trydic_g8385 [Trypoxylus dichotomus]